MLSQEFDRPSSTCLLDSPPSDHALLEELRTGNREAATLLYRKYSKRLRQLIRTKCSATLARRIEADDILQSVFHAFFKGAARGVYDVPDGEELWPLLLVIAVNKIHTQGSFHLAAKRDVRLTCGLDDGDSLEPAAIRQDSGGAPPLHKLVADEALERIPQAQREIVELRVAGYEVEEIAGMVGRSKRTVERLLQSCRSRLSTLLEESPDAHDD
jgi:RNA polymerase sigma factor (sigma-70 family)